uniref:dihydrofolate reductase n=1 Tax=Suricata suricatta TaxID=37032 RepID=A0A673TYH7_SURSU
MDRAPQVPVPVGGPHSRTAQPNFAPSWAGSPSAASAAAATAAALARPLDGVVAASQDMGIGQNGDLPWPPLRNFRRMTTTSSVEGKQNSVIMGRKTWFSLPEKNRPLTDRINRVLSRNLREPPQGAHFLAQSLDDALKLTEQPGLADKGDTVWTVRGKSVYKEAMNRPGQLRLSVTRIMQEFESDPFFPEIGLEKYKLLPEYPGVLSDVQEEKGISTNLKCMRRTINVKMFSDICQVSFSSNYIFLNVKRKRLLLEKKEQPSVTLTSGAPVTLVSGTSVISYSHRTISIQSFYKQENKTQNPTARAKHTMREGFLFLPWLKYRVCIFSKRPLSGIKRTQPCSAPIVCLQNLPSPQTETLSPRGTDAPPSPGSQGLLCLWGPCGRGHAGRALLCLAYLDNTCAADMLQSCQLGKLGLSHRQGDLETDPCLAARSDWRSIRYSKSGEHSLSRDEKIHP